MLKKIKIFLIAICGIAAIGFSALAITGSRNVSAEAELIIPQEYAIEKEYVYGETFNIPAPREVRIKNGSTYTGAVDVNLRFPDGTTKSEGNYTLDKTGVYEVTYYDANGFSATQNFTVYKNYYELGASASARYVSDLVGVAGKSGISVQLKDGNSFIFNKPINLKDCGGQSLEICKIFPMFREDEDVNPDVSTVSVKIVDCYDSTKFVEFYIWCGEAGQGAYYLGAGASTQVLTGLEQNKNRPDKMTEEYEGELYQIHRPQRYQSKTAWGRYINSQKNSDMIKNDGVILIWDLSNNQMKAKNGSLIALLTDIDSTEIYGANAIDAESFFTTGEVYLNIEAYNYGTTSFEIGIEEIFGMRAEELEDGKAIDEKAPEIYVNVETTTENAIYVQKDKTTSLPEIARVLDYNYYGDLRVEVFRNYGKNGQVAVKVKDGEFTPTLLGNYTAVYTATDSYGNKGEFLLDIIVLDEENIVYEETALDKLVAAKVNVVPYIQATGLNKEVEVNVYAYAPDGIVKELDYIGNGYEFIPEYAGEYTINYVFRDNVYVEEYSYSVACVDENSAVFKKPFAFPAYFMKGASYTVKPVIAYTAGNGGFNENTATVSVSVDGNAYQTLSAAQMQSYKVDANQTLQFKASYRDSYTESEVYSVIDVGFGKKTTEKNYLNYMQGNYSSATLNENGATYEFEGNADLRFINKISMTNFKTSFGLQADTVESIVVTLRNACNPYGDYVTYTYAKTDSSNVTFTAKQYENGKLILENGTFTKYKSLTGDFTLTNSYSGISSGDAFIEGVQTFEEDGVIFEVNVYGAINGCEITFSQINNQTFSGTIRESKPQMTFTEYNGVIEVNSVYEITPCYANSVMCSVLVNDVKLTVLSPDGEIVSSLDGVRLENVNADKAYSIKLTQVGQYRVNYNVSCMGSTRTNGQETLQDSKYYIVNVSEGIAPTIEFKDGSDTQTVINVKVGGEHKIKEFVVTDNLTATENIKVYTMIFDKGFRLAENGYGVSSYVFNNVGEFLVYVIAYDELGNSSALYYNVVVS